MALLNATELLPMVAGIEPGVRALAGQRRDTIKQLGAMMKAAAGGQAVAPGADERRALGQIERMCNEMIKDLGGRDQIEAPAPTSSG
jgi:hypothetical protein